MHIIQIGAALLLTGCIVKQPGATSDESETPPVDATTMARDTTPASNPDDAQSRDATVFDALRPPPDAPLDALTPDFGAPDAESLDAETLDARRLADLGPQDAGVPDAVFVPDADLGRSKKRQRVTFSLKLVSSGWAAQKTRRVTIVGRFCIKSKLPVPCL